MSKLCKCMVCDNYTVNRYLGEWVHKSCFDYIVLLVVRKFGILNNVEVMKQLKVLRNWQPDGFADVDSLHSLLCIINQKIETVKEP